jgi:uncharacterized protein YbaA (DUF1428 family)
MAHYVDGFVIPIKSKNLKAYKKMATWGRNVWMKHGALDYYECVGDEFGKHGMGFKKMCKLKGGENIIFAFVIYKNKAHRNKINKKVMKEMSAMDGPTEMPFEMKRFAMAGFKTIVKSK